MLVQGFPNKRSVDGDGHVQDKTPNASRPLASLSPPPVVMDKRIHPGRLQRVSPVWERRSA